MSAQGPSVLGLGLKGFGLRVWGQGLTIFFVAFFFFSQVVLLVERIYGKALLRKIITLIVSKGWPTRVAETPPHPPAKKF